MKRFKGTCKANGYGPYVRCKGAGNKRKCTTYQDGRKFENIKGTDPKQATIIQGKQYCGKALGDKKSTFLDLVQIKSGQTCESNFIECSA
jgi:hypothetical protein